MSCQSNERGGCTRLAFLLEERARWNSARSMRAVKNPTLPGGAFKCGFSEKPPAPAWFRVLGVGGSKEGRSNPLCSRNAQPYIWKEVKVNVEDQAEQGSIRLGGFPPSTSTLAFRWDAQWEINRLPSLKSQRASSEGVGDMLIHEVNETLASAKPALFMMIRRENAWRTGEGRVARGEREDIPSDHPLPLAPCPSPEHRRLQQKRS